MEILLQALLITTLVFGPTLIVFAYAIMQSRLFKKHLNHAHTELSDLNNKLIENDNRLKEVAADVQVLKGGMIETDEMIDNLFDREKLIMEDINSLRAPKKKIMKKRIVAKLQTKQTGTAKDMVFHLTNPRKASSRRMK